MDRKDEQAGEAALELGLPAALSVLSGFDPTVVLRIFSSLGSCLQNCRCFLASVLLLHPVHISL